MDLKRILLISLPIVVVVGGVIILRRRMPTIQVLNTDWDNNRATIKFGNNTQEVSLVAGQMNGGLTYSNRYTLNFYPVGRKTRFEIKDSDGTIADELTIDYSGKLVY
jgi:hypothetical protein